MTRHFYTVIAAAIMGGVAFGASYSLDGLGEKPVAQAPQKAAEDVSTENLLADVFAGQTVGKNPIAPWYYVDLNGNDTEWPSGEQIRGAMASSSASAPEMLLLRWPGNYNGVTVLEVPNLQANRVYHFSFVSGNWNKRNTARVANVSFADSKVWNAPGAQVFSYTAKSVSQDSDAGRWNASKEVRNFTFLTTEAGTYYIRFKSTGNWGDDTILPITELSLTDAGARPTVDATYADGTITFEATEGAEVYYTVVSEGSTIGATLKAEGNTVTDATLPYVNGTISYYSMLDGITSQTKTIALKDEHTYVNCTDKVDPVAWSSAVPGDGAVHNFMASFLGTSNSYRLREKYYGSATTAAGVEMSQTVTGLENGTYKVQIYAAANRANGVGSWPDDINPNILDAVFASSGENTAETNILAYNSNNLTADEPGLYTVAVEVTDGTITMGVKSLEASIGHTNWYTIQLRGLQRVSTLDASYEKAVAALNAAKTDATEFLAKYPEASAESKSVLQALIDRETPTEVTEENIALIEATTAALGDANQRRRVIQSNALAEDVEGCVNMTNLIKNPMAADGTNSWQTVATGSGQNFGGDKTSESPAVYNNTTLKYFDGWSSSSPWYLRAQQSIALGAGKYRISVLARGSDGNIDAFKLCVSESTLILDQNAEPSPTFSTELGHHSSVDGEFGRGWDMYYLDFEIETPGSYYVGVYANCQGNGWVSFTDFGLAQLESDELVNLLAELATAKEDATNFLAQYPDASAESINALKELVDAAAPATVDEINAALEAINNVNLRRAIVESNAVCGGMTGVVSYTDLIQNPCATEGSGNEFPGWTLAQADGGAGMEVYRTGAQKPTLADGTQFNYFNPANWGGNDWTTSVQQTITLPSGKYRLSVLGRGSDNLRWFRLVASTVIPEDGKLPNGSAADLPHADIPHVGSAGELFGAGWNMAYVDFEVNEDGPVCIGVQANTKSQYQWQSFTDFQIVRYGDAAPLMPAIKVNGMEEELADGGTLTNEGPVEITFDVPEGVTLWYKWTPATTNLVAEAEDVDKYAGFTEYTGEPVHLEFQGTLQYYAQRGTARSAIKTVTVSVCTGIENVAVDAEEAAEYYNLNGVRVDASNLAKGIYIRRTANGTSKVIR